MLKAILAAKTEQEKLDAKGAEKLAADNKAALEAAKAAPQGGAPDPAPAGQTVDDVKAIFKLGSEHGVEKLAQASIEAGEDEKTFREKMATVVLTDRRVSMTKGERESARGTMFSFDKLALYAMNKADKNVQLAARYEIDLVENHDNQRSPIAAKAIIIPDHVIDAMRLAPAIGSRQQLAVTTAGASAAIAESVDYMRSQMALYDRMPLMMYCDEMPNQVGDAKIPIWSEGPGVGATDGVASVNVTSAGSGYTAIDAAPAVTFSGGGGSGAAAVAVKTAAGTAVSHVIVTNPGNGYTSTPTVSITGNATATAVVGAEGVQTALSTPTLATLNLTPRAFDTQVEITEIANLETGRWLTEAIRMHMIPAIDEKVMRALLNDPTDGIRGLAGIKTVSSGAATWGKMVEMESEIDAEKAAEFGRRAYVVETGLWGSLKTIDKANGAGRFVLDPEPYAGLPGGYMINGYPALRTTLLPDNMAIFSDWYGNMKVPSWSGYEFSLDNITNPLKPRLTMYKFCRPKATTGRGFTVAQFTAS